MTHPRDAGSALALLLHPDASARQLARGWVDAVDADGTVRVHAHAPAGGAVVRCDRLTIAEGAELRLARGDVVLYWEPASPGERGVVLGRIGAPAAPAAPPIEAPLAELIADGADRASAAAPQDAGAAVSPPAASEVPDELVLEARESLTLRVGDGSITLRADGRILIKGTDLVSHARRLNRIRGGAVSIN